MNNTLEQTRSSWLLSYPVMGLCLLLGVLAAFFRQSYLAVVLLFLFVLSGLTRLWAFASARHISVHVSSKIRGMFPGEEASFQIEVRNQKFLPVVWLDLFCPLDRNLCMVPLDSRKPDEWEALTLQEEGSCTTLVGERRFSFLLWYETLQFTSRWTAKRRGIYSMKGWRLRTGDGLGLAQVERLIPREDVRRFAVYPKLIPVSPALFLRNLWNADTGTRGVMEDPTVIRSTRDYMTSDSFKQINWRLSARGLPLTVNVYENILPRSVHFIFDGESFNNSAERRIAMEDALSILASEVVRLHQAQVACGLSFCAGERGGAINLFNADSPYALLQAMAAYEPLPPKWDNEASRFVAQTPVFDALPIYDAAHKVGRFYYISYDAGVLSQRELLRRLDHTCTSILTYTEPEPFGSFETVCLRRLKEGESHA